MEDVRDGRMNMKEENPLPLKTHEGKTWMKITSLEDN